MRILQVAAAEIGTLESPPDSNKQKYSAALGRPAESWCADFVVWCMRQVGVKLPSESPYTPAMAAAFGNIHIKPQPGDVVFYHWPGMKDSINHVGIVESVDFAHNTLTAIEGNTSSGDAGSQDNGGGVFRRVRPFSVVVGFGRPTYPKEATVPDAPPCLSINLGPNGALVAGISVVADAQGNVKGYYILGADGGVFGFGAVPYLGRVQKA